MLTLDSETCGLHGCLVLLQYAYDDSEIKLYCPWEHPVRKTLTLLEEIADNDCLGFNLAFDWFMLCKLYTCFRLLDPSNPPQPEEVAEVEREARDGPCIKPRSACDIMLHARKTQYQSLMDRRDIRIRRVPTQLAYVLAEELEKRIQIDPIYFERRKKKNRPQWNVYDIKDETEFKDIVLKFEPTTALKALAKYALGIENVTVYKDIDLGKAYWPDELGYCPLAYATKKNWTTKIAAHIEHWTTNENARKYAANDVEYTRGLYKYFGSPAFGDDDSELACMVACNRWRGYTINVEGIERLQIEAKIKAKSAPRDTRIVRERLENLLTETELVCWESDSGGSTKKTILEKMRDMQQICPQCLGGKKELISERGVLSVEPFQDCRVCKGEGKVKHNAAQFVQSVLDARTAALEDNLYGKLLLAQRLQADLKVIGTLSSRMSGASGLNVQAIPKEKRVRNQFPLAKAPYVLCGGDFEAFEIVLAIACWKSKTLEDVVTSFRECHHCNGNGCKKCDGKGQSKVKIHAVFGTYAYPGWTYEQIVDSNGTADDRYTKAKSMLFALIYGGEAFTLANRGGLSEEEAESAYQRFIKDFPDVGKARKEIFDKFATMRQLGGIGSKVSWEDPAEFVDEPVTGHRRYFTLENRITKVLYQLASNPPKPWLQLKVKVQRRDRLQTVSGAVQSALYAAAFQIQGQVKRAAANHQIQSAGAKILKRVQRRIWDLQEPGVHEWAVQPLNIHDELMIPTHPDFVTKVTEVVNDTVEEFRDRVPLLSIDWKESIPNWGAK